MALIIDGCPDWIQRLPLHVTILIHGKSRVMEEAVFITGCDYTDPDVRHMPTVLWRPRLCWGNWEVARYPRGGMMG